MQTGQNASPPTLRPFGSLRPSEHKGYRWLQVFRWTFFRSLSFFLWLVLCFAFDQQSLLFPTMTPENRSLVGTSGRAVLGRDRPFVSAGRNSDDRRVEAARVRGRRTNAAGRLRWFPAPSFQRHPRRDPNILTQQTTPRPAVPNSPDPSSTETPTLPPTCLRRTAAMWPRRRRRPS